MSMVFANVDLEGHEERDEEVDLFLMNSMKRKFAMMMRI